MQKSCDGGYIYDQIWSFTLVHDENKHSKTIWCGTVKPRNLNLDERTYFLGLHTIKKYVWWRLKTLRITTLNAWWRINVNIKLFNIFASIFMPSISFLKVHLTDQAGLWISQSADFCLYLYMWLEHQCICYHGLLFEVQRYHLRWTNWLHPSLPPKTQLKILWSLLLFIIWS